VGCDADRVPLRSAMAATTSPEERDIVQAREISLLYVGCTRARECLLITYSGKPSPYLKRPH